MEKQVIKNLMSQLIATALHPDTQPIKTANGYCWQDFEVCDNEDVAELATIGVEAKGTIYENGRVQLVISVDKTEENINDAYKRLKAKNLVLISKERAADGRRAAVESLDLLNQAAAMLNVTTNQALELVK